LKLRSPTEFSSKDNKYVGKIFRIQIQPNSSNPYFIKNNISVTLQNINQNKENINNDNNIIKIQEQFNIKKVHQLTLLDGLGLGLNSYIEYRYKLTDFKLLGNSSFTNDFILSFINGALNKGQ
jgi:hypothetical protein